MMVQISAIKYISDSSEKSRSQKNETASTCVDGNYFRAHINPKSNCQALL